MIQRNIFFHRNRPVWRAFFSKNLNKMRSAQLIFVLIASVTIRLSLGALQIPHSKEKNSFLAEWILKQDQVHVGLGGRRRRTDRSRYQTGLPRLIHLTYNIYIKFSSFCVLILQFNEKKMVEDALLEDRL